MQRKDWKEALRRIKLSPAGSGPETTERSPRLSGRHRVGRWMLWGSIVIAALLIAGVALSAFRSNSFLAPLPNAVSEKTQNSGDRTSLSGLAEMTSPDTNIPGSSTDPKQQTQSGGSAPQQAQPWDRMVIRTATLGITVKDVGASLDRVRSLAGAHGGYVTQTDSHQDGDYTVASITMQVPTQEFDGVVSELRKFGVKPAQESIASSDVTEEYTDLQSQLRNMQATEDRVLALMGKTEQINDVLTLDRELRDIRGQIEQIQGRINFLSKRSEMSTITVSLSPESAPVLAATLPTSDGWDPAQVAVRSWNASLDLLAGVGKVVITAAVYIWWAVPLLLALWVFTRPRRRTTTSNAPVGESS